MRNSTKLMLALVAFGSLSLVSCKDYSEDDFANAAIENSKANQTLKAALEEQLNALQEKVKGYQESDNVKIKQLNDAIAAIKNCTCNQEMIQTYITNFGLFQDSIKTEITDGKSRISELVANTNLMKLNIHKIESTQSDLTDSVSALTDSVTNVYNKSLEVLDAATKNMAAKADTIYVDSLYAVLRKADTTMKARIDSICTEMTSVKLRLDTLASRIDSLNDARIKQVTGITVQQVYTPAYGSYNSLLTNTQTTLLVGYYGTASQTITFPSASSAEKIEIRNGMSLIAEGTDNAGRIYVTINPREVDFEGIKEGFALVNSLGDSYALKLGEVEKSAKVLQNGYTRAASDSKGFYEIPVQLTEEAAKNPNLHLNIDKSAIKTALSDLIKAKTKSDGKVALKEIVTTAMNTINDMKLPALGMECAWKDVYGEHSVVSALNMSAVAVQPLGFNSLDGFFAENGAYWDVYNKAKSLSTSVAKNLGTKIANALKNNTSGIQGTIADLQDKIKALHFDELKYDGQKVTIKTQVKVPSMTVTVPPVTKTIEIEIPKQTVPGTTLSKTVEIEYEKPTSWNEESQTFNFETVKVSQDIEFTVDDKIIEIGKITKDITIDIDPIQTPETSVNVELDITKDIENIFNNMVGQINPQFNSINELVDALNGSMDQINAIFDKINNLEETLSSGSYINGIYKYTDKIAQSIANIAPRLMKPMLLVNSDAGFGLCGHTGAPSTVKGTVKVIPTTWSAELLTPIYAKYISVNGKQVLLTKEAKPCQGIDITTYLDKDVNTVTYSALDYKGNEYTSTYVIVK